MEQFDQRENVIRQFNALFRPGEPVKSVPMNLVPKKLNAIAGRGAWDSLRFIDGLIEHEPFKKVVGFKNFSACEPYFATHFPYKPVAPGVLLMTFMGEVCQYLIKDDLQMPLRARALVPTYIRDVRFRKFVEPGDQCILTAEIVDGNATCDSEDILIKAQIVANDKRVMQAEMGFRTMYGRASQALNKQFPYAI
jgi:3-hydroxymyristoyl/3-hydroxydecanoyl-(acyl carrier protein) dehydratase